MPTLKTILALTVPVGAALLGLLWFFRRKDKAVEPPDKCEKDEEREQLQNDSATANKPKPAETHDLKTNAVCRDIKQRDDSQVCTGKPNPCEPVLVEKIESKISEPLPQKSIDAVLETTVNHIDCTGDHGVEIDQIIEETVTFSEAKLAESVPHVASSLSSEQKVTGDNKVLILEEEVIIPVQSQEASASRDTIPSHIDSDKVNETNASADKTPEQNETDKDELCEQNAACESSNNSLSRSWHEEVSEQCDNEDYKTSGFKDQMAKSTDFESKDVSPKPQLVGNGVSSDGSVVADRLTKSPLSNEKRDDAQTSSDASSNCDNLSEASNDSGKGGSVTENSNQSTADEERIYEFNIPSDMCGLFIGTRGKTVKNIRDQSGARIRLRNNPYTPDFQICVIEGPKSAVDRALSIIKRKFPSLKYPGMDLTQLPSAAPVIMPEIMQLGLPEGVSVDVVVSSIVDAGRVFVQQPTHPSFPSLERLNAFMNQCYLQDGNVPDIPKPIESGVICAAPMLNGWYRAQIMSYYEKTDECDIKYVDYGGYSHLSSQCLKQIRSDFMTLPFEAVECYLGNITPLDNESYYSNEAAAVLEELTQGKLLQAQVVGRAEDGIPYVHIYQINGSSSALMVNRELVNRGVVRWMEMMS